MNRAPHGIRCAVFAALIVLIASLPRAAVNAQPLIVPLTGGRTRPIEATTLFHTLFSDFYSESDDTTYVQTGDIPAMWLRDSSAQTIPYVRFADGYPVLSARFAGVIERNAKNVLIDAYANAFTAGYKVWERKWEVDSPAWTVLLAWSYWQQTRARTVFTPTFHAALRRIVDVWRCEQLHATCSRYHRKDVIENASSTKTGMIWSAFRPSDDPAQYHFNIPQEALAAVALTDAARLAVAGYNDSNLANQAQSMAAQVLVGIQTFGRVWNPQYGGWVYVYETDGLGRDLYADDANVPNLTSLPYIGYCSPYDATYLATRAYALSSRNPYYYSGLYAQGLGSPHTPAGFVWPLGIIARALTATSEPEVAEAITTLAETDSSDGLIHESFWPNGYWLFTRQDFGWGNALYAELLFRSVAGFAPAPATPFGMTLTPFERTRRVPTLTNTATQLHNSSLVYGALNYLLDHADNHTIIPSIHRALQQSAGPGDLHWHQLRDVPRR